jgi:hypothetical protein
LNNNNRRFQPNTQTNPNTLSTTSNNSLCQAESLCHDSRSSTCSKVVVSVSQAFAQSKSGRLFQATTEPIPVIGSNNAIIQLCNPCSCNTTVYLSSVISANHSPSPISIKTFFHGTVKQELLKTIPSGNTNMYVDCSCRSRACLQCGTRIEICNGLLVSNVVVNGYDSFTTKIDGTIILSPDCSIIYELCSVNCSQTALASVTISWWEVPNCEELIRCCL